MSEVQLTINGYVVKVPVGSVVAAAIAIAGVVDGEELAGDEVRGDAMKHIPTYRRSVRGEDRAPLCGMGICFECRVTINGQPHRLSCQTICEEGMRVETT